MQRFWFFLVILLLPTLAIAAPRRVKSGGKLTPRPKPKVETVVDTIRVEAADIVISGYDKPLKSNKETFFITNNLSVAVSAIAIDIEYLDADGRQLHRRQATVRARIPADETRAASIPSWDKQQSFCYIHSSKPPRAPYIPYTVKITVNYVY